MFLSTFELKLKALGRFTTNLVNHHQSNEEQLVIYEVYGENKTRRVALVSMDVTDSKSTNFNNFKALSPEIRRELAQLIDNFAATPVHDRFPHSTDVVLIGEITNFEVKQ